MAVESVTQPCRGAEQGGKNSGSYGLSDGIKPQLHLEGEEMKHGKTKAGFLWLSHPLRVTIIPLLTELLLKPIAIQTWCRRNTLQMKGNFPRIVSISGCFSLRTQQPQPMNVEYFPFLSASKRQRKPLGRLQVPGKAESFKGKAFLHAVLNPGARALPAAQVDT